MASKLSRVFNLCGYDLLLGSIAAFYIFMAPYTKVEESFNVQAMHDILYHGPHLDKYDHLEFPGVVPRTFIGAFLVAILASPVVFVMNLLQLPKIYSLIAGSQTMKDILDKPNNLLLWDCRIRLALGGIILLTLRFFRIQVRNKFGRQVEVFFVILSGLQFHLLFYCSRPLPNVLALGLVNIAYAYLIKGNFYLALNSLIFATLVFRCDILLLLAPLGVELLLTRSISLLQAIKYCLGTALGCIGLTVLVDSIMWRRSLWPEFEVLWFNSVLNRSSEWGTQAFHWYFTSALPRALLAAYPLSLLGVLLDRRLLFYVLPVYSFVLLYSKLPHKELRFIIGSVPMFNLAAAVGASRIYNNRRKSLWKLLFLVMVGSFFVSLGCTVLAFLASYENYPSGYALKFLHESGHLAKDAEEQWVHIDTFSAMNGISRFCEDDKLLRYSKEEGIHLEDFRWRNFTFLISEQAAVGGYKCLFSVKGFSRISLQKSFPPIALIRAPKVFVHGNLNYQDTVDRNWRGCS